MDPLSLSLAFSAGLACGIVLGRWVLPAIVDVWVALVRRHGG